jgi:hypothetical protein
VGPEVRASDLEKHPAWFFAKKVIDQEYFSGC